jgi:hypothetical protein
MLIKIEPWHDNRIIVTSPYNRQFVAAAKQTAGKWDDAYKAWIFPAETAERVREICREVYGQDDRPVETVRLRVKYLLALDRGTAATIVVAGRDVARAYGRDSGARLGEDVVIVSGGFRSSGSIRNFTVKEKPDTVFDLLRMPLPMAQRMVAEHPEQCRIVPDDGIEPPEIGQNSEDDDHGAAEPT